MKNWSGWLSVYEIHGRRFRINQFRSRCGRWIGCERIGLTTAWARLPELPSFYHECFTEEYVEAEARELLGATT